MSSCYAQWRERSSAASEPGNSRRSAQSRGPENASDGTTSYGARRRAHPSLLAAALVVVVSLALLGMVLVDPGQRGSLAIIATLTLLTLPLATLLYGPRQRAPWAVLGATLFVVAVELSLRGAQPGLGGPDT